MNQLNEYNRLISNTRQPFVSRHNGSCVYYGVRGNARGQYLWDKSCVLDGADMGIARLGPGYVVPQGPMGVARLGPGYAMPLGEEVISPVGVLWNGAGLGMNQGSMELLGSGDAAALAVVTRVLNTIGQQSSNALVVGAKTSTAGAGEIVGLPYVMLDRDTFAELLSALAGTPGGAPVPRPLTGELAEFLVDGASQIGTVSAISPLLQAAENVLRARVGAAPVQRNTGMTTKAKVLLGVGLAAAVGTVAFIAFSKPHTSLNGSSSRRRRRRRKS